MIELMAMVLIITETELSLSAFGNMTYNMDMDTKLCLMVTNLKAITNTEKRMDSALSNGSTARPMSASFKIMNFMELVLTDGEMVASTKETGAKIRCMAKVYSNGQMAATTSVGLSILRCKAKAR